MLRALILCLLLLPGMALGEVTESDLIGDWEWLGNSFEQTSDYGTLLRTGPSIKRFIPGGRYEYISVFEGKQKAPVVGSWKYAKGILSITRPDNGTFHNKVISYQNGIMELQDTYLESFIYMKRMD